MNHNIISDDFPIYIINKIHKFSNKLDRFVNSKKWFHNRIDRRRAMIAQSKHKTFPNIGTKQINNGVCPRPVFYQSILVDRP